MSLWRYKRWLLAPLLVGVLAHAETDNPFAGYLLNGDSRDPVVNPQGGAGSMASGIFNGMRADENAVTENPLMRSRGREYKADDAANQGNTGAGVAIGTGSALIARGTPMTRSLDLATVIAGYQLIGMGARELAQGAANLSASSANTAQRDLLLSDVNSSGYQLPQSNPQQAGIDAVNRAFANSDLSQTLASRGVNADDFYRQLGSGQLGDVGDLMRAAGYSDLSAEDLARGNALADSALGKVAGAQTGYDESAGTDGGNLVSPTGTTGVANVAETLKSADSLSLGGGTGNSGAMGAPVVQGERAIASINPHDASAPEAGLLANIFGKNSLFGGKENGPANPFLEGFNRVDLESLGVQKVSKGQNIFKMARRTFKSFSKWRRGKKSGSAQSS